MQFLAPWWFRHLPPKVRSSISAFFSAPSSLIERFGPARLLVFGPSPLCAAVTTASADFCSSLATPLSAASLAPDGQISQRKTRDFPPIYPVHLRPVGPDGIGLRVFVPPRPPPERLLCTSCSTGQESAYSFLPTPPRGDAVAVRLGVPAIKPPEDFLVIFKGTS